MKDRMTAKLEVKKIMDEVINSAVGGYAVINQSGSEEEVIKNEESEVFIPAPQKKEEPKSQNKDKGLTTFPREQVHHTDQIVLEISHFFQIHEILYYTYNL